MTLIRETTFPPVDAQHGDCVWIKLISRFIESVGVNIDLLHVKLPTDQERMPPSICELECPPTAVKVEIPPVPTSRLDGRNDLPVTLDFVRATDDPYLRQP